MRRIDRGALSRVERGRTGTPPFAAQPRIELGPIVEAVEHSTGHAVDRDEIDRLLRELLAERFSDARVLAYLPIFLHRAACEILRERATTTH
jgi:hypothetical protein